MVHGPQHSYLNSWLIKYVQETGCRPSSVDCGLFQFAFYFLQFQQSFDRCETININISQ